MVLEPTLESLIRQVAGGGDTKAGGIIPQWQEARRWGHETSCQFFTYVENQFHTIVACVRSDNAKELGEGFDNPSSRSDDSQSGFDDPQSGFDDHQSGSDSPNNIDDDTSNSSTSQSVALIRQSTRCKKSPSHLSSYYCNTSQSGKLHVTPHWCNLVCYDAFPSSHKALLSLSSVTSEPKSYEEASKHPLWLEVINKELKALSENQTWDLVDLPSGKKAIGNK
ncbi:hypothetical protein AgCh_005035 [Apium graveolens]